jgi:2-C-methyl-D-erythritol 4-phosphate cytidylyltransferase
MPAAKVQAIIPAAGIGARLKSQVNKSLISLNGKPLLFYSLDVLEKSSLVNSVVVVAHPDNLDDIQRLVKKFGFKKVSKIIPGGQTRCESVANGIKALDKDTEYVVVHDAARPLISADILKQSIETAFKESAAIVAVPAKSTIKKVDPKNLFVQETLVRDTLWEVQTPQVFKKNVLVKAHQAMACSARCEPTDDAVLVEKIGIKVKIVKGDYRNIKVTTPEDLALAESFLKH